MQIHFQLEQNQDYFKLTRKLGILLYKGNPAVRNIKRADWVAYLLSVLIASCCYWRIDNAIVMFDDYFGERLDEVDLISVARWVFIALLLFWLVYALWLRPKYLSKVQYQSSKALINGELMVALEPQGLKNVTANITSLYDYSLIRQVFELNNFVVIVINQAHFIAIPFSAFANENQRKQFIELLTQKIQ